MDSLTVTTNDVSTGTSYEIDSSDAYIEGLTAQSISLTLSSSSIAYVNAFIGLRFSFTLADTLSKNDYFIIEFPAGTVVNYIAYYSPQLNLTNISYDSSTNKITFYQSSSSTNLNSQTTISITVFNYKSPSSVK